MFLLLLESVNASPPFAGGLCLVACRRGVDGLFGPLYGALVLPCLPALGLSAGNGGAAAWLR